MSGNCELAVQNCELARNGKTPTWKNHFTMNLCKTIINIFHGFVIEFFIILQWIWLEIFFFKFHKFMIDLWFQILLENFVNFYFWWNLGDFETKFWRFFYVFIFMVKKCMIWFLKKMFYFFFKIAISVGNKKAKKIIINLWGKSS